MATKTAKETAPDTREISAGSPPEEETPPVKKGDSPPAKIKLGGKELTVEEANAEWDKREKAAAYYDTVQEARELATQLDRGIGGAKELQRWADLQVKLGTPKAAVDRTVRAYVEGKKGGGSSGVDADTGEEDDEDDDEETSPPKKGGKPANSPTKVTFKDLRADPETDAVLKVINTNVEATREIIADRNDEKIRNTLSTDPTVGKYWPRLTEKQRERILQVAKATEGVAEVLRSGALLKQPQLVALQSNVRSFVTDVYPDPKVLGSGTADEGAQGRRGDVTTLGPHSGAMGGSSDGESDEDAVVDWSKVELDGSPESRTLLGDLLSKTFTMQEREEAMTRGGNHRR